MSTAKRSFAPGGQSGLDGAERHADHLVERPRQVRGVREAMVVAAECMACLKVDTQVFDEAAVEQLLREA